MKWLMEESFGMTQNSFSIFISNITRTKEKKHFCSDLFIFDFYLSFSSGKSGKKAQTLVLFEFSFWIFLKYVLSVL